jgi:hypothetical protein
MRTLLALSFLFSGAALCLAQSSALTKAPSQNLIHKVQAASMRCGLAPLPPLGCRVGDCVCDQQGQNCKWTFVCN